MATSHRPQDTLSKRVKPLIRRSSGSTRAAPPAPAPRRKTVSPLVPAPAATPAAVSRAGTTCQHLRTGPAQAKPPQQPLSARARDNEARAYLHAPTPRDSRSVPSDSLKVTPTAPSALYATRGGGPGGLTIIAILDLLGGAAQCMGFSFQPLTPLSAWHCMGGCVGKPLQTGSRAESREPADSDNSFRSFFDRTICSFRSSFLLYHA